MGLEFMKEIPQLDNIVVVVGEDVLISGIAAFIKKTIRGRLGRGRASRNHETDG